MMWTWSGNLKADQEKAFREWLKKNRANLEKHMPPGFRYKGTYGTVFGLGKYDVMCIMEFGKMADFDVLRRYDDPEFNRFWWEYNDFFVPGTGTTTISRPVEEWVVMEPPKTKKKR